MDDGKYRLQIAGDVDRDGQFIEAWEGEKNIAYLFTAYETNTMTFWCEDEVPLSLVETMIATAIDRRHDENTYKFLLRKDQK